MPDPITVFEITGPDAGVEHVLQRHHDQMRTQSPEESCHVMTGTELRASGARIFAASDGQTVFGIGALKPIGPKQIELKSMHTISEARGKGVGGMILDHLMTVCKNMGAREILLETGSDEQFRAARSLYEKAGFTYIAPFADYRDDPLSSFMAKTL